MFGAHLFACSAWAASFRSPRPCQRQRVGMRMHRTAHQQVAAHLAAGGLGHRLVHAQLVDSRAAFQVKIVQQVDDHVTCRGHHIHVPRRAVAVHRHGAAAIRQERAGQADVLHRLERRFGDVHVLLRVARAVVQHRDAVGDQLHMPQFLGRDAGDQAVERPQLAFAAEVEALEHVVAQGGHLAVFAPEQLLQGRCRIGIGLFRLRQGRLQLVDSHEHGR